MHTHQLLAVGIAAVQPEAQQNGAQEAEAASEGDQSIQTSREMAVGVHRHDVARDVQIDSR